MSDSRSMKIVNVPRFVTLTPDVARLKVLGLEFAAVSGCVVHADPSQPAQSDTKAHIRFANGLVIEFALGEVKMIEHAASCSP